MKQTIITFLLKYFGIVGKMLAILLKDAVQKELAAVLPIAVQVVQMIADDPSMLASNDKASSAFKLISAELITSQRVIASSTINLAIELAVQSLNAGK
jgi:hypothetical protein